MKRCGVPMSIGRGTQSSQYIGRPFLSAPCDMYSIKEVWDPSMISPGRPVGGGVGYRRTALLGAPGDPNNQRYLRQGADWSGELTTGQSEVSASLEACHIPSPM